MERPTHRLIELLDQFVATNKAGHWDQELLARIGALLPHGDDPGEFVLIADRAQEEDFIIPVDDMIAILRRWVAIAPTDPNAKRALGVYMYGKASEYDEESQALIREADAAEGKGA